MDAPVLDARRGRGMLQQVPQGSDRALRTREIALKAAQMRRDQVRRGPGTYRRSTCLASRALPIWIWIWIVNAAGITTHCSR
jgi:hypothetical protein